MYQGYCEADVFKEETAAKEILGFHPLEDELLSFAWHPHDPKTFLVVDKSKKASLVNLECHTTVDLSSALPALSSPLAYSTVHLTLSSDVIVCWDRQGDLTTVSEDGRISFFSRQSSIDSEAEEGEDWEFTKYITPPSDFSTIDDEPAEVIWAKYVDKL